MGLFGWLFKQIVSTKQEVVREQKVAEPPNRERDPNLEQDEYFFSFPSRQFFGQSSRSASCRYRVAWGRTELRNGGAGRYLLLEGDQVLAEGKMIRPDQGKVANNGTFILIDNKSTKALSGTFYAFDTSGRAIVRRDFKANIFSTGLSDDGRVAVCQTCNALDSRDSSILAIFDLAFGKEITNWKPASGWADHYEFSADGKTIGLGYRKLGVCFYTMEGNFVDRSGWENTLLEKGDYGTTLFMANIIVKGVGRRMSPELSHKLISCIDRVAPGIPKADSKWQAVALKLRGTCLDAHGTPQAALSCYDQALALDPKVGVKGRADQLRKKLAQSAI